MKQTRISAAIKRARGATFTLLHEHEWAALEGREAWWLKLFLLLLRRADYGTGQGSTSYPWLAGALAPMQPARGPRLFAPDAQACKRAVLELEQLRIVARDKRYSDATKVLFFEVAPRYVEARPTGNSTPKLDPSPIGRKASNGAGSSASEVETRPLNSTPSSRMNSFHKEEGELSTVAAAKARLREQADKLRARRRPLK